MKTRSNVFATRLIIAASATILGIGTLYVIGLYVSNLLLASNDDKYEMHGITAVMFGFMLGPLTIFPTSYLKTGQWGFLLKEFMGMPDESQSLNSVQQEARGLESYVILMLLTTFWLCVFLYCQVLYSSIYEATTDPHIIGVKITPLTADIIQNTMRGTIYNGTFFPLAAASAFLSGWLAKKTIHYSALLIPASFVYGIINLLSIIHYGQASVIRSILHVISAYQHFQNPQAIPVKVMPDSLGLSVLLWVLAIALFFTITASLAFYGWLWSIGGRWFRQRLENI